MTRPDLDRVPDANADVRAERLAALRDVAPEAFTDGKLDVDALRALLATPPTPGPSATP